MSLQTAYITTEWFYISITLCMVLNRLYVRALYRARRRGLSNWSDGLVVIAWLFVVCQATCDTVMYTHGVMLDIEDLQPDSHGGTILVKVLYVEDLIYYIPLYSIKGAILCFLLEITPDTLKGLRKAIWCGIGFVIVGFVWNQCAFVVYCPGGEEYWRPFPKADCDVIGDIVTTAICWHMFTDLYIYILPFFVVRKMTMVSRSQKLAAFGMFATGFLLVGIAFIQIGYFSDALGFANLSFMFSFWWSIHEQNLAITVACLPALRATIRRLWKKYEDSRRASASASPKRRSWKGMRARGALSTKEVFSKTSNAASTVMHTQNTDLSQSKDKGTISTTITAQMGSVVDV